MVAIDSDIKRLDRVYDNLERLQLRAGVICGDARYPEEWWTGSRFDRILLDAPCSATGGRRHPDISGYAVHLISMRSRATKRDLRCNVAPAKEGGTMVYAACSITPQENVLHKAAFLERTENATLVGSISKIRAVKYCLVKKIWMASTTQFSKTGITTGENKFVLSRCFFLVLYQSSREH